MRVLQQLAMHMPSSAASWQTGCGRDQYDKVLNGIRAERAPLSFAVFSCLSYELFFAGGRLREQAKQKCRWPTV